MERLRDFSHSLTWLNDFYVERLYDFFFVGWVIFCVGRLCVFFEDLMTSFVERLRDFFKKRLHDFFVKKSHDFLCGEVS